MTTNQYQIRYAKETDIEKLVHFNSEMAKETEGKELVPKIVTAGVKAVLHNSEAGFYFMVEHESQVVGSLMITTEWSDWRNGNFWWIQSVYVIPEYRRKGVFRSLYQHVKKLASDQKEVCGLRLYVERENTNAQKTYESLGMQQTNYALYEEEF